MRPLETHEGRSLPGRLAAAIALAAIAVLALAATPALAVPGKVNKADFARFQNCPIEKGEACLYGETLEGEFKIGNKTTPLTNPVILQGGLIDLKEFKEYPLYPPRFGAEEASKSPQTVPGGLTGLSEAVGGPVIAVAEQAGTIEVAPVRLLGDKGAGVVLPIKVHLENEQLGPNCYIGSDAEPIVLHLTDGTTEPPEGTEPISGSIGKAGAVDKLRMLQFIDSSLVDNTFPVPAATGCGTSALLEPVITALVNVDEGLPAAAGKSYAILTGNQYATTTPWVVKYDKKLLEEKEGKRKAKK